MSSLAVPWLDNLLHVQWHYSCGSGGQVPTASIRDTYLRKVLHSAQGEAWRIVSSQGT